MSVYISGPDWHIIPDFDAPPDFHASERTWYLGAKENPGRVFITEPYLDAHTGTMCFTVSTMLSDGKTVVGMDLNFSKAQESIMKMTDGTSQTAMIVTSGGLIAGYTDMSFVGEQAADRLPVYKEILRRVITSNEHDSFQTMLDGQPSMIFSSETSNHWFLILSVGTGALYADSYGQIIALAAIDLLMLMVAVIYYIVGTRDKARITNVLAASQMYSHDFAIKLQGLASQVQKYGDDRCIREAGIPEEIAGKIRESGDSLATLAADLSSYSVLLRQEAEKESETVQKDLPSAFEAPTRRVRNGIVIAMLLSLVIVLFFCVKITSNWGSTRMNREADKYESQLKEWSAQQKSILYMFTDVIAASPELLDDYDSAVRWLNGVSAKYQDISLCYIANPYREHPVIMSNGWEPSEIYRPETRPWYKATERSVTGFSISAPYMDAQSGTYCITFSRIVNGENGEFLGIFGIDFFMDKLIHVLGESYTNSSYAFLVDSDGVIINHPNSAYQMDENRLTSVEDTEYAASYNQEAISVLRDFHGEYMVCLSRKTDSGFSVLVANRWWNIYGSVVLIAVLFIVIFCICLAYIVSMINRLIRWQEKANRQLVASAQAAESANRAKSQFLSQMSHEIRTPMNAIIGLNHIALRDESISQRTRTELEKISASAQHLLSLINDILDMSRIESGRMVLKEERFSFRDFVEQVNVIINGQCEDKGLRYEYHQTGPIDQFFIGDALKLKQVLINILGNSVKFTETPSIVSFSAEQTGSGEESCILRFTMKDTGIGMDKEFIPKLFQAFSQEDATNTNRYGGSGLGMAISKSIIEMMGGEISVESEKGVGSTFTVTVKLNRTHGEDALTAAEQEAPEESVSLAGRHLLIAEDQPLNAEILIDLLEMEDISTEWVENGQLAVKRFAACEEGHFDGILMDMRMPVMDGLTATQEIRKLDRPDAAHIPIIALTANAFEEDVKQCLQAGMNAHLAKPVDIEQLKKTLGRLL